MTWHPVSRTVQLYTSELNTGHHCLDMILSQDLITEKIRISLARERDLPSPILPPQLMIDTQLDD